MQLNLALFSFNNACGYIEKPFALCRSRISFDPRLVNHIEDVPSYQITVRVLSGQFLCQDREPTFVDICIFGMYGQLNKRNDYRVRAKGWNGFRAIYDGNELDSDEGSIQFSKIILPEMAALRFSVTADDGTFLGQCFIPIAHLQTGYRYVPLKNQMNIPVNASNLFIFVEKEMYLNAKEQELADKLSEPWTNPIYQSFSQKTKIEDDCSSLLRRHHQSSDPNCAKVFPEAETNSYAKHFIVGSELNDKKRLCKVLSLSDIHPEEVVKRDKTLHQKLRRLSSDLQSVRSKTIDRFRKKKNLYFRVLRKKLNLLTHKIRSFVVNHQRLVSQRTIILRLAPEKISSNSTQENSINKKNSNTNTWKKFVRLHTRLSSIFAFSITQNYKKKSLMIINDNSIRLKVFSKSKFYFFIEECHRLERPLFSSGKNPVWMNTFERR